MMSTCIYKQVYDLLSNEGFDLHESLVQERQSLSNKVKTTIHKYVRPDRKMNIVFFKKIRHYALMDGEDEILKADMFMDPEELKMVLGKFND